MPPDFGASVKALKELAQGRRGENDVGETKQRAWEAVVDAVNKKEAKGNDLQALYEEKLKQFAQRK